MTNKFKKIICTALATCLILCFTPLAANAASKPAKVAKPSVKVSGKQATITWKAASNAEKYQVKIQKKKGGSWTTKKNVKVKDTSYIFTGSWKTTYRVTVRGVAEKNGKWSAKTKFKIGKKASENKKNSGKNNGNKKSSGETKTVKCFTKNLNKGETYYIQSPSGEYKTKTKVTYTEEYKWAADNWGWTVDGKTADGGVLSAGMCNGQENYLYESKDFEKYIYWARYSGEGTRVRILDDDVTFVWTLDGTEPKLGQKDHFGTSDKYARYNGEPVEMQLRGSFDKANKKGVYQKEILDHEPFAEWVKAYKGKKVIMEGYVIRY